jgi:hypothetical protein
VQSGNGHAAIEGRTERLDGFMARMKLRRDRIRRMLEEPPRNERHALRRTRWIAATQRRLIARRAWLAACADHASLLAGILSAAPRSSARAEPAEVPHEPMRRRYSARVQE